MAEDLNVGINANTAPLDRKLREADRKIEQRERKVQQIGTKIQQQETRLQRVAQGFGAFGVTSARTIGTAALTLSLQSAVTESGFDTGGVLGRLAVGVGVGAAFGGPAGAAAAAIAVSIAETTTILQKTVERVKRVEAEVRARLLETEAVLNRLKLENRAFALEIRRINEELETGIEQKFREQQYQILKSRYGGK